MRRSGGASTGFANGEADLQDLVTRAVHHVENPLLAVDGEAHWLKHLLAGVVRVPVPPGRAGAIERNDLGAPRVADVEDPVLVRLQARLPGLRQPGHIPGGDIFSV